MTKQQKITRLENNGKAVKFSMNTGNVVVNGKVFTSVSAAYSHYFG